MVGQGNGCHPGVGGKSGVQTVWTPLRMIGRSYALRIQSRSRQDKPGSNCASVQPGWTAPSTRVAGPILGGRVKPDITLAPPEDRRVDGDHDGLVSAAGGAGQQFLDQAPVAPDIDLKPAGPLLTATTSSMERVASSMERVASVDRQYGRRAVATALATSSSLPGLATRVNPVGASTIGTGKRRPSSVVVGSTVPAPASTRGRNSARRKSAALRCCDTSSSAPPSMYSNTPRGSRLRAISLSQPHTPPGSACGRPLLHRPEPQD
jgi:hypothetical protein